MRPHPLRHPLRAAARLGLPSPPGWGLRPVRQAASQDGACRMQRLQRTLARPRPRLRATLAGCSARSSSSRLHLLDHDAALPCLQLAMILLAVVHLVTLMPQDEQARDILMVRAGSWGEGEKGSKPGKEGGQAAEGRTQLQRGGSRGMCDAQLGSSALPVGPPQISTSQSFDTPAPAAAADLAAAVQLDAQRPAGGHCCPGRPAAARPQHPPWRPGGPAAAAVRRAALAGISGGEGELAGWMPAEVARAAGV